LEKRREFRMNKIHCKFCNFSGYQLQSHYKHKHPNVDYKKLQLKISAFSGKYNVSKRLSVRKKIKRMLKGRKTPWSTGKTMIEILGKKRALECSKKRSTHNAMHKKKYREKVRKAMIGRKITWGDKLSKANIGKKLSKETIEKRSKTTFKRHPNWVGCCQKGKKNYMYSVNQKGKNNGNWKGGGFWTQKIIDYGYEFNKELKLAVKIRDKYSCRICGKKENRKKKIFLNIHHVDYNKKNNKINNLVSLCSECHTQTNHRRQRWMEYFLRGTKGKKEFLSYGDIGEQCEKIVNFLKNKKVTGIVPIPRGGVFPAFVISNKLNIPLKERVEGKNDVIVDEIVDFGLTFHKIKKLYPRNLFVCLHLNKNNFKLKKKPDFFVKKVSKYIVYPWERKFGELTNPTNEDKKKVNV
jgi:hypoxanthine phosphoribosyltransferase